MLIHYQFNLRFYLVSPLFLLRPFLFCRRQSRSHRNDASSSSASQIIDSRAGFCDINRRVEREMEESLFVPRAVDMGFQTNVIKAAFKRYFLLSYAAL